MSGQIGLLEQVDGSATFTYGTAEAITSVTGPIEVNRVRNENPTRAFLDINIKPAAGVPGTRENVLEQKLSQILTPMINVSSYPRQSIQIVCQLLKTGEPTEYTAKELVVCVNSTFLALLNAGIALNVSFLATCCAVLPDSQIVVAPTSEELSASESHHVVVFDVKNSKTDELIFCDSLGQFTKEQFFQVLDHAATDIEAKNEQVVKLIAQRVAADFIWKF